MATSIIPKNPSVAETPSFLQGQMAAGGSISFEASGFFGAFSVTLSSVSASALFNAYGNNITKLAGDGADIPCTYANGTYTITNPISNAGLRYNIVYK